MSSAPPTSLELWAAAKIIGRECATINKDYLLCKREDENPKTCEKHADKVTDCAHGIVKTLQTKSPKEFQAFQSCLDFNDYRYSDCRATEQALLASWSASPSSSSS